MIIGTGIDIIEVDRIASAIERRHFIERVFTAAEQAYCDSRQGGRAASYAARFAGKEAVMKALGTGLAGGRLLEIEIVLDDRGRPGICLHGCFKEYAARLGVTKCYVSLTHARLYAAANVVLWGENNNENCDSRRNACD